MGTVNGENRKLKEKDKAPVVARKNRRPRSSSPGKKADPRRGAAREAMKAVGRAAAARSNGLDKDKVKSRTQEFLNSSSSESSSTSGSESGSDSSSDSFSSSSSSSVRLEKRAQPRRR